MESRAFEMCLCVFRMSVSVSVENYPVFANGLNVTCIFKLICLHLHTHRMFAALISLLVILNLFAIVVKFTFYMILIN